MHVIQSLAAGLLAGFGVAGPIGPVGTLLLREGLVRGWRGGLPGALAVASVDASYAGLAVLLGATATVATAGWAPWPGVLGGALLVLIGAVGCRRAGEVTATPTSQNDAPPATTGGRWRRFALFVALTAVNPLTLVSFAALTTGLTGVVGPVFVTGVAVASASCQVALVGAGALLGARVGRRGRRVTGLVGSGVVAGLGVLLVARALGG